jgi:hypothetical protein
MKLLSALSIAVALVAFASPAVRAADGEKPKIAAADAREHVGKEVVVEMTVEGGRKLSSGGPCLLNSMKDFRDKKCLTLAIMGPGLAKYKEAGIDDPSVSLKGKKVTVTGKIELFRDQPQIKIDSPDQIQEVKEGEEKKPETPKVGF